MGYALPRRENESVQIGLAVRDKEAAKAKTDSAPKPKAADASAKIAVAEDSDSDLDPVRLFMSQGLRRKGICNVSGSLTQVHHARCAPTANGSRISFPSHPPST
jgi:hypothetical protein